MNEATKAKRLFIKTVIDTLHINYGKKETLYKDTAKQVYNVWGTRLMGYPKEAINSAYHRSLDDDAMVTLSEFTRRVVKELPKEQKKAEERPLTSISGISQRIKDKCRAQFIIGINEVREMRGQKMCDISDLDDLNKRFDNRFGSGKITEEDISKAL